MSQSAEKQFLFEDPRGLVGAWRQWGAPRVRLEVHGEFESSIIIDQDTVSADIHAEAYSGTSLRIVWPHHPLSWQHSVAVPASSETLVRVRVTDGVLYLNGTPTLVFLGVGQDWLDSHPSTALSLGSVPNAIPAHAETLAVVPIHDVFQDVDIGPLAACQSLRKLDIGGTVNSVDLVLVLGRMSSLTDLELPYCIELTDLSAFDGLINLTALALGHCVELLDISAVARMPQLRSLLLHECMNLTDIRPLQHLPHLEQLALHECKALEDLAPIAELRNLNLLILHGGAKINDLQPLSGLNDLGHLDLEGCQNVKSLAPLAALTSLTTLLLPDCNDNDLTTLSGLSGLQILHLGSSEDMHDLTPLTDLSRLRGLSVMESWTLTDLTPLAGLIQLQALRLSSCMKVSDLRPLSGLQHLISLSLDGCIAVEDLTPLGSLTALRSLNLSDCPKIAEVKPLRESVRLTHVHLDGAPDVRDIDTLASLSKLRVLHWTEIAAPHAVLAAAAFSRRDTALVRRAHLRWIESLKYARNPNVHAARVSKAIGLGCDAPWVGPALGALALAMHARRVGPNPWAAWARAASTAGDEGFAEALRTALAPPLQQADFVDMLAPISAALRQADPAPGPWVNVLRERVQRDAERQSQGLRERRRRGVPFEEPHSSPVSAEALRTFFGADDLALLSALTYRGYLIDHDNTHFWVSDNAHKEDPQALLGALRSLNVPLSQHRLSLNARVARSELQNTLANRDPVGVIDAALSFRCRSGSESEGPRLQEAEWMHQTYGPKAPNEYLDRSLALLVKGLTACGVWTYHSCAGGHYGPDWAEIYLSTQLDALWVKALQRNAAAHIGATPDVLSLGRERNGRPKLIGPLAYEGIKQEKMRIFGAWLYTHRKAIRAAREALLSPLRQEQNPDHRLLFFGRDCALVHIHVGEPEGLLRPWLILPFQARQTELFTVKPRS